MANVSTPTQSSTKICSGGIPLAMGGDTGGLFLPLFEESEDTWGRPLQIFLYIIGLCYLFLGVSIIAEVFMSAIEKITAAKKRVKRKDGKEVTVKVWNGTVANLSLMALGSSAPEILLSLIELVFTERWHSGALGPGTIVGSAAFNLLVIVAVCIVSLPPDEVRVIKDTGVFAVTAFSSIFAYVWLVLILMVFSPDVVEIWEGALTLAFMPLLVLVAYLMDIGYFHKFLSRWLPRPLVLTEDTSPEDCQAMIIEIEKKYGKIPQETSDRDALLYYEFAPSVTRAAHRVEATRHMSGGSKSRIAEQMDRWTRGKAVAQKMKQDGLGPGAMVSFVASHYAVVESEKKVQLEVKIVRTGGHKETVKVKYETRDGEAEANKDYKPVRGTLTFAGTDRVKPIEVKIIEDNKVEPTEEFYMDLKVLTGGATLGNFQKATVVVIDSDGPGTLAFERADLKVPECSQPEVRKICVVRKNGANGQVQCSYRTEDDTAKAGSDYTATSGTLTFESGQTLDTFDLEILPKSKFERDEYFRVILDSPTGGVTFDKDGDGGKECNIMTVLIASDPGGKTRWENFMSEFNWDEINIGHDRYIDQFREAIYVGGSPETQKEASKLEWVLHLASVPWKLIFAMVPPTDFAGGWVTFCAALCMIGVITALIGDMANLLGCALDVKAPVVAVTLVALGTSLPDTFASMISASQDPTADNSIGNVTGSNSVNVFLGLGLPWMIGAIYWKITGHTEEWEQRGKDMGWWNDQPHVRVNSPPNARFVVVGGSLGPSVGVFCVLAATCIGTLMLRRKYLGGELGGSKKWARLSAAFLVLLWIIYIGFVIYSEGGLLGYE